MRAISGEPPPSARNSFQEYVSVSSADADVVGAEVDVEATMPMLKVVQSLSAASWASEVTVKFTYASGQELEDFQP
ncbi:hypothetical protein ABZZ79_23885 [Streptomyces sp. NPDC006458]|uniref:hypothetical protein n=1 Tax=Streptomyces sp. NPDC006458 TaxID=3154302 RepID=UPI0033AE6580